MKTKLPVAVCWVLCVFIHADAATDRDFQSVLTRLSELEDKQAFSEQRIAALETENKMSQKRIADLEEYKTVSDRRVASLERRTALCNRRNDALDFVKKLYAQKVALETEKTLPDKATINGYDTTLSDGEVASFDKGKIMSDINIATPENDSAVSSNRNGKEDKTNAAVNIKNRSTAGNVLQSEHRRFVAEGTVAFSAIKQVNQEHMGRNQNIIFDQVLTNEGGGYHPNLGGFIAPQSGVYVFSSTIMTFANAEAQAAIVHNGNIVTYIYGHGDSGYNDQGSQTVVLKLSAGDEVTVQNRNAGGSLAGNLFSSFTGFRVLL